MLQLETILRRFKSRLAWIYLFWILLSGIVKWHSITPYTAKRLLNCCHVVSKIKKTCSKLTTFVFIYVRGAVVSVLSLADLSDDATKPKLCWFQIEARAQLQPIANKQPARTNYLAIRSLSRSSRVLVALALLA